jgi:hypothetical protein
MPSEALMATLFSADVWKTRLRNSIEGDPARMVFVVGAGLSWDGKVGVWGVSDIVK